MKTLAKIIAFVIALILVIALPLAVFAYDLGRVVFNPPLIKRVVTDEVVNSDLIPVALEWFSDRRAQQRVESGEALTGIIEPDIVLLMSFLDRHDWREIKAEVLTDENLTDWVSVTVDGLYTWIDSSDRTPQITWQLKPFKEQVDSEHGIASIKIAYDNLPPCAQPEIDDFLSRLAAVPSGTDVLYNICAFPDPWYEDQFNDYVTSLQDIVKEVPDEFALTDELAEIQDTQGIGPDVLKSLLRQIRTFMNLAPLIIIALLLIILILCIRSLRDLSHWWGFPLLVGGVLTLLPTLIYRWLITSFLAAGPLSETPQLIREEATRAILRLASEVFRPMLFQSLIIILAVSIVLIILSLTFSKSANKANG